MNTRAPMPEHAEVLVAIINSPVDFRILCEHHWYRIPVDSADKWLKRRWPPRWLAFYQTKVFGEEAYSIRYFAEIAGVHKVSRARLFPDEPAGPKRGRLYYQIRIGLLQTLAQPILSRRLRRIVFIPTTWDKFQNAKEINDLYDESPLEDRLWAEFKRLGIRAERQEHVQHGDTHYFLDFAIYCGMGKLDVETDGDTWHTGKDKVRADNRRDNALTTDGWRILRFNTPEIHERIGEYCVPKVLENINRMGGIKDGQGTEPRKVLLMDKPGEQLELF